MSSKVESDKSAAEIQPLRERAEFQLRDKHADLADMPAKDLRELVYELNVHQMELEIQNEELRRAQVELANVRDRYSDLYEFAPVGYLSLQKDGEILEANLTAAEMLGINRRAMLRTKLSKFITHSTQDAFYLHRQGVFSNGTKQTCEIQVHKDDDSILSVRLESVVYGGKQEQYCRTVLVDITERKEAEEALVIARSQ